MHDHIHRQIARTRIADAQRANPRRRQRAGQPEKPPPWIRKHAAAAAAKAAARIDAESARRAIAR